MIKKNYKIITFILVIMLIITGCGKKAKLKNGNTNVIKMDKYEISANDYFNEIKKANVSKLVDMIDHKIFDKKYPSDDKENKEIEAQIKQIKSSYTDDEDAYLNAIRQYFGVNSEKELESMLRLEYKRNQAVRDHVKSTLSNDEVKKYYNENISGDIKASHILIKPNVSANASDDEKAKAEEDAKIKAENIIKKLNKGKSFKSLAKKYSDDDATKNNSGDLGYFDPSEMEENFAKTVKELNKGEYTKEPIKTSYGYHIIIKNDEKEKPSLKSVQNKIKETLMEKKLSEDPTLHYNALIEIREKNHVKWEDKDLKKAYDDLMQQLIKATKEGNKTNNN